MTRGGETNGMWKENEEKKEKRWNEERKKEGK